MSQRSKTPPPPVPFADAAASAAPKKISPEEFIERSRTDREFYFKNAVRLRPKHARHLEPLVMRPGQKRLMDIVDECRAKGRPPRVIILKARQIGFSTIADCELFRVCHLWPHQQAIIIAHRAESAEILFSNVQRTYDNLPASIKPEKKYSTKRLIHFKDNDSRLQVEVAGESRGFTAQILHVSELAFVEDAGTLMTAIMQTVPEEPESLVILESTPNGIGNEFHDLWVKAQSGRSDWIPLFIPWFEEPTYTRKSGVPTIEELEYRVDDAGKRAAEIVRLHGVSLEQIAWWLNKLENDCFGDLDRMEQEYPTDPVSCFMASGSKVFDRAGLQHYMNLSGLNPDRPESPDERRRRAISDVRWHTIETNPNDRKAPFVRQERGGRLWIARPPVPRHRYIVAFDLSGGDAGSDATPGVVLNRHTLNLDAVWDDKAPPEVCADFASLMGYHYNRGQVVGEANNHGILFHSRLINELRYPDVYFRLTSESTVAQKVTDKPGFWTSGENREHLFNLLRRYVRETRGRVEYERMVLEWSELQRDEKTKRVDHPDGGSSDLSIAFAIALAVHLGSFEADITPLSLETRATVIGLATEHRARRMRGLGTSDLEEGLDVFGMTIEDVDRLYDAEERRVEKRRKAGIGSMT